ncbi:DUF2336 domain-containing protein [Skermanella mucosa]|uniref:DUF2336 domain-containing protein n=1 Tax=Skermanella mucosa TaxID=1789672 RepID=UPI001E538F23|nr:DUF2336 domain-containing protein [Skermanella mucosa]UEM20397.1 DUF2336 domain-containing protein [Skermanella mucosa]
MPSREQKPPPDGQLDYETSKRMAQSEDTAVRAQVAGREDVRPELLYYLAIDPAVEVRREVAANRSAPAQASAVLARDSDESVRRLLADKLARLLPDLSREAQGQLFQLTVRTLEQLARDQAVGVRQALASSLKDVACAPPDLCAHLARDVERGVAEPILHYCATLTDQDLLSIIANQPKSWVLSAIAQRDGVSGPVAAALYETGDIPASTALLDNHGALIPEHTLSGMVEQSTARPSWQEPLAKRPRLPGRLAVRLAEFVDQHVLTILRQRRDLDGETAAEVVSVARRRIDYLDQRSDGESPEHRVRRLFAVGQLDESAISDALSWNDMVFVKLGLALMAGIAPSLVEEIIAAQSPKGVTALAWRAGLSMRCAMQLQSRAANIPPRMLLNARNGVDYPLTPVEMTWQLEFYGVRL